MVLRFATSSQELSIKKSEKCVLIDGSKKWWRVQNARGVTGYVPSNFMKKSKPSFISSLRNTLGRRKGAEARAAAAAAAALSTAPQQQVSKNGGSAALSGGGGADVTSSSEHSSYHSDSQLLQLGGGDTAAVHASSPAVAKYAYTAQQPDELTLAKGTCMFIIGVLLVFL